MYNCIRQVNKKYNNILDDTTMEQMVKEVNEGKPAKDVLEGLQSKINKAYNNNPLSMTQVKNIQKDIDSGGNAFTTIRNYLAPEPGKGNVFSNVETHQRNLLDHITYKHHDTLNKLRNKLFGNKVGKDLLSNMAKVIFKEIDNVEASQALKQFKMIDDEMYGLYVASGGLNKQGTLGIQHNPESILGGTVDDYITAVSPLVRNTDDELKALYNRALLGEEIEDEALDFIDANAFQQYSAGYGTDLWSSFMNRLQKQATATAFNKTFGPNTKASIEKLIKDNNLSTGKRREIENLVNQLNGKLNIPEINNMLTKYSKGARSLMTASMLGGAVLTAVSDLATVFTTAGFNGMNPVKAIGKSLHGLYKASDNEKQLAQLGWIGDEVIEGMKSASRFDPHSAGTDMLSTVSDKVLRGSGLMKWTDNLKNAWKLSHLGHLATLPTQYNKIDKITLKQLKTYGITKKDWDAANKAGANKGTFFDVTKLPDDLNFKFRKYVREEGQYAILEPGALNQSILTFGTQAGTVKGELTRHAMQFKSFLLASVLTHMSRIYKLDTVKDQAEYTVKLGIAGTMIGMVVLGLKDIKNGNDPSSRDYSDPQNIAEAMMVSGVAGPLGDMLLKESKFGDSMFDLVSLGASPVFSKISQGGKALDKFVDEDTSFSKATGDAGRFAGSMVPGRSNFYTQWLTDELGRDLMLLNNPSYQKQFDKIDRARKARESKSGVEEFDFFN